MALLLVVGGLVGAGAVFAGWCRSTENKASARPQRLGLSLSSRTNPVKEANNVRR